MQPGDQIAGRFIILDLAGRGGMSEVWRARDRETGEEVAIKVHAPYASRYIGRFSREAKTLASLAHPHIVRLIDYHETEDGRPCLILEWLEGEDLAARMSQMSLSIEESVALCRRLAEALAFVHARGVVHRDIKPENIFLSGRSLAEVKLLDFGIARLHDTTRGLTQTGTILGTPGYLSPEQASEGKIEVGPASDIFSLGCVLFECLTGRLAFPGSTVMAILAKILFADPTPVRELRADIPLPLASLVARMLSKDPARRPQDGAALLKDLDALLDPGPEQGPRPEVLTDSEQRLFCVLMIQAPSGRTGSQEPLSTLVDGAPPAFLAGESPSPVTEQGAPTGPSLATLREVVTRYGGRIEALPDGSLAVVLSGAGVASDQAIKAVRCALALGGVLPGAPMTLATGRSEVGRLSEVIDSAVRLLKAGNGQWAMGNGGEAGEGAHTPLFLDEVSAGLLDAHFTILREGKRFLLSDTGERSEQGRTLLGRPSPYIGREQELSSIEKAFDDCLSVPIARGLLVMAPAGFGKSRLCQEACARLSSQREVEIWSARGDPLRAGAPFGLLSQALRKVFSIQEGEPLALRQQKLVARVKECLRSAKRRPKESAITKRPLFARGFSPPPVDDATQRVAEFLGELINVPFPDQKSPFLRTARQDSRLMGDQMREAFLDWLFAECQKAPLLLVLDDLQWGDLPTLKFIDAALKEQIPFLVLALARPEVKKIWVGPWGGFEDLSLGPLSRRMSERLVRGVLGEAVPALVERLVVRAGGNAFYLEELCRSVAQGRGDVLPETVLAMTQARLESLPDEARRTLRAASVFGQSFWQGGVAALLGEAPTAAKLSGWLETLCQEEILLSHGEGAFPGEEELSFRHPLQREASYSMLTEEDRALGHALAGEWLEGAGEPNAAVLAEHFERGGKKARAIDFYQRAAEQALEGNDLLAALSLAEQGVSLGAKGEQRGMLRLLQIEPHVWRSDHEAAEACALEAMEVLPKNSAPWYKAASSILTVSTHLGHYEQLVALVSALQTQPDALARVAYITDTSMLVPYLSFAGMYDLAEIFIKKVEETSADIAEQEPLARAWLYMARSYRATLLAGDPWGFFQCSREAAQSFQQAGDQRNLLLAVLNIGVSAKILGSYEEAVYWLQQTIAETERLGIDLVSVSAQHYLALSLACQDDFGPEMDAATRTVEDFVSRHQDPLAGTSRHSLSQLYLLRGDLVAAKREASAAAELLLVAPPARAHALATLSMILLKEGRVEEALAAAKEGMEGFLQLGAIGEGETQVMLAYIEALLAAGEREEARKQLASAKERLSTRAAKIDEPRYREGFLKNVSENALLLRLADTIL